MKYLDLIKLQNDTLSMIEFNSYKSGYKSYDKKICENIKKMYNYIVINYKDKMYYEWILAILAIFFYLYLRSFILIRSNCNSYFMSMFESVVGLKNSKIMLKRMKNSAIDIGNVLELLECCKNVGYIPFSSWNSSLSDFAKVIHKKSLRCSQYMKFVVGDNLNKKKWNRIEISTVYKENENLQFWRERLDNELSNQQQKFNIPHILPIGLFYYNLFSCFVNIALRQNFLPQPYSEGLNLEIWSGQVIVYQKLYNKLDELVEEIEDQIDKNRFLNHLNDLKIINDFQLFCENIKKIK